MQNVQNKDIYFVKRVKTDVIYINLSKKLLKYNLNNL